MYCVTSTIDGTGKEVLLNEKDQQTLQKFLWTAAQLGDLSIVVGNGATMAAAAVSESESAKSWMSVVEDLCKTENIHEIFLESRQKDLLQIAELVSNLKSEKHKEFDIYDEMRSLSMLEPSSFHFAIRKLCEISKVRHIITTNYDNLIEEAFFDIKDNVRVLVRDPSVPNYLEIKNKICISKMHGSCQPVRNEHEIDHFISRMDFHDSIVMSESDYDTVQDHLRRQDTKESILLQAASKPVLIIGKGLYSSDTTFLYLLRKTKIARLNNMARVINAFMLPTEDRTEFESKFINFSGFYLMFEKPTKDDIIKLLNLRLLPLVISTPPLEYVKNYHRATCLGFDWLFQNRLLNDTLFKNESQVYMKKRMALTTNAPHCLCIGICAWNRYFELLHMNSMDLIKRNIPTSELEGVASGPAFTVSATCNQLLHYFPYSCGMISMIGRDEEGVKIIKTCQALKLNWDGIVQLDKKNTWKSNVYLTRTSSSIFMDSHTPFTPQDWEVLIDKLSPTSLQAVNSLLDNLLQKNTSLKVVYLDKYLFKPETSGVALQDNYLYKELLKFSLNVGDVDILLETGAYKREEDRLFFLELSKLANILTVSFGFFTRYLLPIDIAKQWEALSILQTEQQIHHRKDDQDNDVPPIPFKMVQKALHQFVTLFTQEDETEEHQEVMKKLLQGIAEKADCFVNPNAKKRRWIIVTLQIYGSLGIDLLKRKAVFVKNHQPVDDTLYSSSAGDVFRGALAAELILSHYYHMQEDKLMEHCLLMGNHVSSHRCKFEKMSLFYESCQSSLSKELEQQPTLFQSLQKYVKQYDF